MTVVDQNSLKMKAIEKNMGKIDSGIRLTLAVVLFILFLTKTVTGTIGFIDLGLAVLFTITSFVGFCPLYKLVGIKSCPNSKV
jgi:hypothetical protein